MIRRGRAMSPPAYREPSMAEPGVQRGPHPAVPLARETALAITPALAALLAVLVFGELSFFPLLAGLAAGLLVALLLARAWTLQVHAIAAWLWSAGREGDAPRSPVIGGSALEWLVWPSLDLFRRLRRLERRRGEHDRHLGVILDAITDPLLIVDDRNEIRLANAAALRTFGMERAGLPLGRATRDPGVLAAVRSTISQGTASNLVFTPLDDRLKQFAVRIVPFESEGPRRSVLLALRERTEQVMIERMRSDFVANASHEIRTPLAALVGIIETLRGPAREDPAAREMFLATMAEEASRMSRLVEDLLSLSRIELAANRPPEGSVDLAQILDGTLTRLRGVAREANVRIEVSGAEELPPVPGDADQLHQLLGNLIDNAIKYGGPDQLVRVEAARLEAAPPGTGPVSGRPAVCIAVIDRGDGIPAGEIARLTERFYRVDKARSRRIGGTGLGLAICKHIVKRHQGHLAISSELGRGSRFAVYLPVASQEALRHDTVTEPS